MGLGISILGAGAAGLPGIGTMLGGASALLGYHGQRETNAANAHMADVQMNFQERMANTAHQREVADLKAAGLNPVLSGTGGAGAPSGPGAMARMESELGAGVSSGHAGARLEQELKNMRELNERTKAETANIEKDTHLKSSDIALRQQQGLLAMEELKALEHESSARASQAKTDTKINESDFGQFLRWIERIGSGARPAERLLNRGR